MSGMSPGRWEVAVGPSSPGGSRMEEQIGGPLEASLGGRQQARAFAPSLVSP